MVSIFIQGPKQTGINIDVFLEPLMKDMVKLWNEGVRMWDQYQQEYFTLKIIIFVYIHDAPRGFTVSGQTKEKRGCPVCVDEIASVYLPSCRKLVFMWHRRFMERKHKYRKMKRHFDNTVEKDSVTKWHIEKTSIWNGKEHSRCIWEGNNKGIKEKEKSNFNWHPFQEASNCFHVPSILKESWNLPQHLFDACNKECIRQHHWNIAGHTEEDKRRTEITQWPSTVWFETRASSYIKI
jgi:hypothetical protein